MKKESITFGLEQFNNLFPFYILIDTDLRIQSIGKSLNKVIRFENQSLFSSLFYLKRPELRTVGFEGLRSLLDQVIILKSTGDHPLILRGQFNYLQDQEKILFIGSPWFDSINEIKENKLTVLDFAIHDPMIDLLHILQAQNDIKELLQTVQKQKKALIGINTLAANLLEKETLDEIAWTITENVINRFDLEDCIIYLVDEDKQDLVQIAAYGDKQSKKREILNPIRIKIGQGIVGKVALTGKPMLVADTSKMTEYIVDTKIRYSELTVPIIVENKVIGIIDSEHSEKNFFTKQNLTDFTTIANLTAIKIKNALAQEKQALIEKDLLENRRRYEKIVESASDIIFECNADGFYTYVNPVFLKKTGYSMEELKEMHFLQLVEETYRGKVEAFYLNQFQHKTNETYFEFPGLSKSGEVRWLGQNVSYIYNSDGSLKEIEAVARDLTEKKNAEIALQRSEEKYRGIIANMELGILEVDSQDKIQYVNQSFCKMSGFSSDELLGQVANEVLLPQKERKKMVKKNELRNEGISDAYVVETANKNKEPIWWLISGGPSFDNAGNIIGSIGIHLDITKQKEIEKELKLAKQIAEKSSKAKEYFLANMSHEIRTPLNAIIGMVRELGRSNLNEKQSSCASNADTAAEHLLSVINNILDISKIEAGEFHLENKHFNLRRSIEESLEIMTVKAKEKRLDLIVNISEDILPTFVGDPARIRQILINLLSNAIKFTEKGGVSLHCQSVSFTDHAQKIHITLKDTGIGIDKRYLHNIFEKFTQEDKSTSRKYGGTGLGMAITNELIQLMGGEITVDSKKGKGTTINIYLTLPIGNLEQIITESGLLNLSELEDKRVLLVEDNEMNRLVVKNTLSYYNLHITEAKNGKEAIKKIKEKTFDIILMDIQMPIMDGIKATKIIRNELNDQTPIIALTANAFKKQIDLCLSVGMDDYVTKPFDEYILLQTILKVSRQKRDNSSNINLEAYTISSNQKLYDLSGLRKASRGNEAFVEKMINLFIQTIPDSVKKMKIALDEKDFETLRAIAHRIKPSLNDMRIDDLKYVIRQIEYLATDEPQSNQLPILLQKTERVLSLVIDEIKKEMK
jgi:PAS domain S-box-containing protein